MSRFRLHLLWSITGAYWLLIFTLTHLPRHVAVHLDVPMKDKVAHLLGYWPLGILLYAALWAGNPARSPLRLSLMVMAIGLAYGAIDEWLQPLVGRTCELRDWLADAMGLGVSVVIMSAVRCLAGRAGGPKERWECTPAANPRTDV